MRLSIVVLCLLAASCGQKGPLVPPAGGLPLLTAAIGVPTP